MKKRMKKIKLWFNKYINGTKGVISLFLALVMLPFSSTALIIVESARYQNAIELVDEMLDCIGLSSIADFDTYLEDRFGLLAMSQETSPSANFNKYMSANMPALNNSFKYTSSSVNGVYPLGNDGVMKAQLMEYSEITAMSEALYNGLKVDDLLKKLYKQMGVEDLNKIADATTKVADVASSAADLVNAIKTSITEYDKYKTQLSEYKSAVSTFQTKAANLITALNDAKGNLEADADPDDIYDVQAVKDAIKECETARNTLKTETGEMSSSVAKMKSTVEKLFTTTNKIAENANSAKDKINSATGTTLQEDCTTSTSEWIIEVASELTNALETLVDEVTYGAEMQEQIRLLDAQKIKVGKVVCDKASDGDTSKYYIDANSSSSTINSDFAAITIDSVRNGFDSVLQSTIDQLDRENENAISDEQSNSLGKLLDLAGEMLKVTAFYNGELDANVKPSAFHRYNANDVSFASTAVMESLTTIVQSGEDFVDSLTEVNVLKALKAAAEFLLGIGEFLVGIIAWVTETCINLVKLIASGSEIYDTFLLSAYSVYNMPCRINYDSGSSLSGYSYSKIFNTMGGTTGNKVTGSMADLKTLMASPGSGSDAGFRGAEVEYLLIGDENELLNQSTAFFNLYMMRMICNLKPIFGSTQIKTMAGAATVAGWVVYVAIIMAEPMIDALLLVNGQKVPLIKDNEWCYLTPAGMVYLLTILPKMTGLSTSSQNMIKDAIVAGNGEPKPKGDYPMNYQDHMMVLMMLTVSQPKMLSRIANLVQMEAAEYYKTSYTFDLDKSYTYLEANVTGTLNSMFDMEALTKDGPFSISRKRIIGY